MRATFRLLVLVPLLFAFIGCKPTPRPQADASSVVQEFYTATITGHMSGAPSAEQLVTISPFLSDTLRALLAAARKRNEADVARAPDEKPSFAEGDLFSSLFEGPNAVAVLPDSARGAARVAAVRMTSTEAKPAVTWVDHVVLTQRAGRYVIDDIEYGGQWDFANKGTLRASLLAALTTPP